MTLTAPLASPWSCSSTLPPLGHAMSQASKSGVRATNFHAALLHPAGTRPADDGGQASSDVTRKRTETEPFRALSHAADLGGRGCAGCVAVEHSAKVVGKPD